MPESESALSIGQVLLELTKLDPERFTDEGERVEVTFDGYYRDLPWDDFGTCAQPAFENHIFAGVCSAIQDKAREVGGEWLFNHLWQRKNGDVLQSFSVRWEKDGATKFWIEFGESRAEAAAKTYLRVARDTA